MSADRPTLHEALRALSILGVLEIRHGGGIFVTSLEASELLEPLDFFVSLNAENMGDLFDARIHFEPMVAGMAATRLNDEQIDQLQTLVDAQIAAPDDGELFHDTDVEFHKILLDASGNIFLTRVGRMLQVLGDQARRAFQKREQVRHRSIDDHRKILVALHGRDAAATEAAMRQHMINVRNALKEVQGA